MQGDGPQPSLPPQREGLEQVVFGGRDEWSFISMGLCPKVLARSKLDKRAQTGCMFVCVSEPAVIFLSYPPLHTCEQTDRNQ